MCDRSNTETRVRVIPPRSPSPAPSLFPVRPDGDDPTPDNWILFPAKKPERSVADDECNPVHGPRLLLFFRVHVSLVRPPIFLPFPLAPYLSPSLPSPLRVFLRAPWFFSHSAPCRISSIRLIVRRDEKKRRGKREKYVDHTKDRDRETKGEGVKDAGVGGGRLRERGDGRALPPAS